MSLRTRLILSFTLVVVLCLGIAAITLAVSLRSSRDRYSLERLTDMARPIYVQVVSLSGGEGTWRDVISSLEEQAQNNGVYIFLVDGTGRILNQIPPDSSQKLAVTTVPVEDLPQAGTRLTQGTFDAPDNKTFLYNAYYIGKLFQEQLFSRLEAIVLAVPRSEAASVMAGLAGPLLRTGIVALAVSVIIAFFISRSVYRPIQRLTRAVDEMARGDYNQEVPAEGPKEIKGLAVRFNEMVRRVKESQQQLRHFVADVSHQLRTPLTSIQGFAQAILDGTAGDSAGREKAAGVIDSESRRMIKQVEELLELSRMQSGQLEMARVPVDIKELLLHCREVFSLRAEETGVTLRTDIEPLLPVSGDEDRLEQVFSNLLDNALKNTPVKGEIVISARNAENTVTVTISDTGPGIPPEQLPYVFERYYQAGGLRTGFGLGLAIVREIVTRHQGEIKVRSEPGEGTQFIINLPAHPFRAS
jgi:two-component system OmpR family sensor kinase